MSPLRTSSPFSPGAQEVPRRTDAVGEDEREPEGRSLVHDDAPRLAVGEQREDVCSRKALEQRLSLQESRERDVEPQLCRPPFERRAQLAVADEEQMERLRGERACARDRLERLVRAPYAESSRPDLGDDDRVVGDSEPLPDLVAARAKPVGGVAVRGDVDGVREHGDAVGPRAVVRERARGRASR